MSEKQPGHEVQEMLGKATNEVVGLYLADQISALLGTQEEAQRDEEWQRAAREHSAFGEPIKGLRESMKVATETKKAYPPQIAAITKVPFINVEDEMAKEFLSDVLFSRMTVSQGYIDYGLKPQIEARAMASEMGLQEGWRSEQAKSVTLDQAVSRVLQGGLRVAYQTPPRE